MVALELLSGLLGVGMTALIPGLVAWYLWRGMGAASRAGGWVRTLAVALAFITVGALTGVLHIDVGALWSLVGTVWDAISSWVLPAVTGALG